MKQFFKLLGLVAAVGLSFASANESFASSGETEKLSELSIAQKKVQITGVVQDIDGTPLFGATVIDASDGANGTTTNFDGEFSITIVENTPLIVSFIGYDNKTVNTTSVKNITIVLSDSNQNIDEVVVVGYGTQKKENLTGAVSQVKMEEVLGERPVTSISAALQGAIPGLSISGGSQPGVEKSINIRGTTSINGGSPLVLIDNVPGDIDMLNPEDIESVSTLKDAASAAIYGARGAFGVILITTKQGKKNSKAVVHYNNNFGFQVPINQLKQPDITTIIETMQHSSIDDKSNGDLIYTDWLGYVKEHQAGTLGSSYPNAEYYDHGMFIPEGDNVYYLLEATNPQEAVLDDYGFQQTHNLSVSGGSDKITYRLSLGYVDQDGPMVLDKDTYQRLTVSSFVSSELTDWMTTSLDIKYSNSNRSIPSQASIFGATTYPIFYPEGEIGAPTDPNGAQYPVNSPLNYLIYSDPKLTYNDNPRVFSRTVINPIEGLDIAFEYTFDFTSSIARHHTKDYALIDGSGQFKPIAGAGKPNFTEDRDSEKYNSLNLYATYSKSFNKKHNLKFMAGYNQDSRSMEGNQVIRYEIINPNKPSISGGSGDISASDTYNNYALRSGFFRFNYDYNGRYLLELNGRYDGSSKFPTDSRFGFFPSVSAGWNVANEQFMASTRNWLEEFKFRASWGQLGNQAIGVYAYYPEMETSLVNWINTGVKPTGLGMPGLVSGNFTWEKVETTDIGVDISMLNRRLTGTFDVYQRDTKGMLAPGSKIPSTGGTAAPEQNVADLRTRGWELALSWRDNINDDWGYNIGFNVYDDRAFITKYDNPAGLLGDKQYRVGMEIGEIWGYVSDGFYTVEDFNPDKAANGQWELLPDVVSIEGNNKVKPGDIKFKDQDDNNIINDGEGTSYNPGDKAIIGNSNARYNFGIHGGVNWKSLNLSFMLQGTGKRDYWYGGDIRFPMQQVYGTVYEHQLDFWKPLSTDPTSPDYYQPANPDAEFARIYHDNDNKGWNTTTQSKFLLNASYIRLKNITLSYNVPKQYLKKINISKAKVFFSGENILTFTSLPQGVDPERLNWGYPFFATYSCGISLEF